MLIKCIKDKWIKYLGNKYKKLSKYSFFFCWMCIYIWFFWKIVKEIKIKKVIIYFEFYFNYIVLFFGSVNSKNLIKIILIYE